jgi:hypothetical protein
MWIAPSTPYETELRNPSQIIRVYAPSDELRKACQAPECDWNVAVFYLHNGLRKCAIFVAKVFWGAALHAVRDNERDRNYLERLSRNSETFRDRQ